MRKILAVVAVAVAVAGCGGPRCEDNSLRTTSINACSNSGAPGGYCACVTRYLYDSHSCEQMQAGDVSLEEIYDSCNACVPPGQSC